MSTEATAAPVKTFPCELCREPIPAKWPDQEWAAHWACVMAGPKAVNEALAARRQS